MSVATKAEALDLIPWLMPHSKIGRTKLVGDEFLMSARNKGLFYVIEGTAEQVSRGARVFLTVRNINGVAARYGYGLIFHSDPTPLRQGYGFVIDSANRRFRVVRFEKTGTHDQTDVIKWQPSRYIKFGRSVNMLQVIDRGADTELFINCHRVGTISNQYALKDGVVGLYAGSTIPIAFKDLKIDPLPKDNLEVRAALQRTAAAKH